MKPINNKNKFVIVEERMASFEESVHDIEIETAVEQNGKGQDQPFFGETLSGKRYFGVCDGHGSNSVIQEVRKIMENGKLSEIMDTPSPVQSITDHLLKNFVCSIHESSGATMNFGIIEKNVITCTNCGDSRMFVFRNGKVIFMSEDHNSRNEKERLRLGENTKYVPSQTIRVISESEVIGIPSEYITHKNGNMLALTQAIGHLNTTGVVPDVVPIHFDATDEIVALSVSDGVLDMLIKDDQDNIIESEIQMLYHLSAEDLKNKIQSRWLQPWIMSSIIGEKHSGVSFTKSNCDDIGISKAWIRPKTFKI